MLPDELQGILKHALDLHQAGKLNKARRLYGQILDIQPFHEEANHLFGLTALQMGNHDEAIGYISKAIKAAPTQAAYQVNLGHALRGLGRFDAAEKSFQKALEISPEYIDAANALGTMLRDLGRLDAAVACYEKALETNPDNVFILYNLSKALIDLQRFEESVACCKKVVTLKADFIEAYIVMGDAESDLGLLPEAEASYLKALEINPDHAGAYNNLGLVLSRQGRIGDAEAHYRTAVQLAPNFPLGHINLSDVLRKSGRIGEAEHFAGNAVRLAPGSSEAHNVLGLALMELKSFEAAAESFAAAISLRPEDAEAQGELGNALKELGRLDEAVACYQKAIVLSPADAKAINSLGLAFKDLGQLDEALACYCQAIAIAPDHAVLWSNLKFVAKALQFASDGKGQAFDGAGNIAALATYNAAQFALLDYYLRSFRPHEASESFSHAMAALPPASDELVSIPEAERTSPSAAVLPDKLVALLHFGRSGTGLLHSLIDGHPEISTTPGVYLRGFFNAGVWEHITAKGWREIPDRFADMFAVLFDATCPEPTPGRIAEVSFLLGESEGMTRVGENRDEQLFVDRARFTTEALRLMQGLGEIEPRSFLLIVHAAFEKAIATPASTGTAGNKDNVIYHIHNPDDYAKANFLRHAPAARLVMMVREPLQSCESWVQSRFDDNNYTSCTLRISEMLLAIDQVIFRTQDSVGVRLEDLKERPHETLRSLCAWLGVSESPSLYEMTAQGKKWWGDPTSPDYDRDKGMTAFGAPSNARQPGTVFSDKDRFVLGTLYYPFSVRFGYREADPAGFEKDLQEIRPLLDEMLDFERLIAQRSGTDPEQLKRSGSYLLFRATLVERWNVADTFKDYPNMLSPLDV
ncbi:MAG: tetratricopeptide repeat protein [Rhodospirillales bacterium]|nr:tetratricopeptide repeat protein [Rhodospirillales bacterium]